MANIVKQLSIFLENKTGSLNETFDILSRSNIRIITSTLSDTTEYGILRLIADNNEEAYAVLKESRKSAVIREVIAVESDSSAHSFAQILSALSQDGLAVEYMYCLTSQQRSVTILRVNDNAAALNTLESHGIKTLTNEDLLGL